MLDTLNPLEHAILLEIAEANSSSYPFIKEHLPFLRVKSRENTGVGMYVNFKYLPDALHHLTFSQIDGLPSAQKVVELDGLEYGLGFVLDVESGRLNFLELFTYDEEWNGKCSNFRISDM